MLFTTYQTTSDFLRKTQPTFMEDETVNSLILGVSQSIERNPEYSLQSYLATVEDEQGLAVAAVMTPPRNLILYGNRTEHREAFTVLIEDLRAAGCSVPGVLGRVPVVNEFARCWEQLTGQAARIAVRERLFVLTEVIAPPAVPGKLRLSKQEEFETLRGWWEAFALEALGKAAADAQDFALAAVSNRIGKNIYVWERPDGTITSLAASSRPISSTISIGPVYTPPAYRGQGYASNCVAALSQHLLASGWKTCNLFTDLANPTSNSIYQKIGYRAVCDFTMYEFTPAS